MLVNFRRNTERCIKAQCELTSSLNDLSSTLEMKSLVSLELYKSKQRKIEAGYPASRWLLLPALTSWKQDVFSEFSAIIKIHISPGIHCCTERETVRCKHGFNTRNKQENSQYWKKNKNKQEKQQNTSKATRADKMEKHKPALSTNNVTFFY